MILLLLLKSCYSLVFNLTESQNNSLGIRYYITLKLENQSFNLGLDLTTNSSFLFSTICQCTNSSNLVKSPETSSNSPSNASSISYKSLNLSGHETSYLIGNKSVKFLVIEKSSSFLSDFTLDGIVGVGFNSDRRKNSFTEQLASKKSANSFYSIVLSSWYNSTFQSLIEFGTENEHGFFKGKKRSKAIKENKHKWELTVNSFSIEQDSIGGDFNGSFDLNEEFILIPNSLYESTLEAMNKSIDGLDSQLEFPCDVENLNISVVLKIERSKFPLRKMNFLKYLDGKCSLLFKKNEKDAWVFGEPFFKDYLCKFDLNKKQITFHQLDVFTAGFYEIFVMTFIVSVLVISVCGGWCMTRTKNKKD